MGSRGASIGHCHVLLLGRSTRTPTLTTQNSQKVMGWALDMCVLHSYHTMIEGGFLELPILVAAALDWLSSLDEFTVSSLPLESASNWGV